MSNAMGSIAMGFYCVWAVATQLIGPETAATATADQKEDKAACALTFDDGPGNFTEQLLDLLKERRIIATFFVVGEQVIRRPQTVRRIAAEGHEVDNHSFDHPDLKHLSYSRQKAEIDKNDLALRELGIAPKYFRPPYGAYNAATVRAAAESKLILVLWTDDALDWKYHSLPALESHLESHLKRRVGGIYLFHDLHGSTVSAMPDILDGLTKHGCRFVTLSEYMAERNQHDEPPGPADMGNKILQ